MQNPATAPVVSGQPADGGAGGASVENGAAGAAVATATTPTAAVVQTARERHAEERLEADVWDVDAWVVLMQEAGMKSYTAAEPIYKRLVAQFPPVARFWRARAEHCARESTAATASLGAVLGEAATVTDAAAAVFEEGVRDAPTSIELWRAYIAHAIANSAGTVVAILERAIAAAGLDLHATALWNEYLDFLRTRAVLSDSQRRDALRRVFQRAVRTPVQHLENLWRDYTQFEQKANTNKEIGRVLLAEYQPLNVDARTEFRARKGRREGLALTALPIPPRGRAKEISQAAQWRRFIGAERANPSSLPAEELHARVVHAFESALVPLYRYPDVWIEYVTYLFDALLPPTEAAQERAADATKVANAVSQLEPVFERCARALPACVALHVHVASLWTRLGRPASAVTALDALCRRSPSALAYVHLMRVARRVEGRDAARRVFARARKDRSGAGAHPAVYVAAAQLEVRVNKEAKVARNVFEFGLKKHPDNAIMALAFVEWLWGVCDFEYMRVVFEKVMPKVRGDPDTVRALWERWLDVEHVLGDAASVDRVDAMWRDASVGRAPGVVHNVLGRTRFLGLDGMSPDELAAIGAVAPTPAAPAPIKRDPRLARRAPAAAAATAVAAPHPAVATAHERLIRLASAFANFNGPPPAIDLVLQLIMKTPETFSNTPPGSNALPPPMSSGAQSLPEIVNAAGKRPRSDATPPLPAVQRVVGGATPPPTPPVNDVFRARQAAKQARLR